MGTPRFFAGPAGCPFGARCQFLHAPGAAGAAGTEPEPASELEPEQKQAPTTRANPKTPKEKAAAAPGWPPSAAAAPALLPPPRSRVQISQEVQIAEFQEIPRADFPEDATARNHGPSTECGTGGTPAASGMILANPHRTALYHDNCGS